MWRILVGIAVVTSSIWPVTATANGGINGNKLLEYCGTEPNQNAPATYGTGVCNGYIEGVTDMEVAMHGICPPEGVTNGQSFDIVIKYLVDNPKMRNLDGEMLIFLALDDAFPCPKSKK
jgi:hypothetical protein